MKEKIFKKKSMAVSEIIILVLSVVAFSYMISQSLPLVSAHDTPAAETTPTEQSGINPYWAIGGTVMPFFVLKEKILGPFNLAGATTATATTAVTDEIIAKTAEEIVQDIRQTVATKESGWFTKFFAPEKFSSALTNAGITAGVVAVITFFVNLIKTGDVSKAAEAGLRAGIGAGVGYLTGYGLVSALGMVGTGPAGWIVAGFAIIGGILASLKKETDREITFTCKPWQAVSRGVNCERCNNQLLPCTEYQCRSLGTGCELENKDTDNPICIWKDDRDVEPPRITPWQEALTTDYRYEPLPRGQYGVEILYRNDECLPAFQPFTFGVELNKYGYCKIEYQRTASFAEMRYDFGGSNLYLKQHTQQMTFPGVVHLEQAGLNLTNDGEFEFYVRCEAATNGISNREEFLFKFCIDKGPDTTPPEIRSFNFADRTPLAYFAENEPREVGIQAYINEPAQCRWDWQDRDYANMENSLTCSNQVTNVNAQLSYTCYGKLTGLENNAENKFYFRCNDTFGNVNAQSKVLTLIGTQPLYISSVKPNDTTIRDSTNVIKVTLEAETSAGYNRGEASCYYTSTAGSSRYVLFTNTDSHKHSTDIWLGPGNYQYSIRCIDLAGNSDTKQISFRVETDTSAPVIVRAFRDSQNLKIITDEDAFCVYDTVNCEYDFEQGIKMTSTGILHTTRWDANNNFYIKCEDEFGNRPMPNSCSMIIRPFEL